ncbi:DMT family transporter [Methylopila sp. Yamaguchi]|uniref:DMT family transporter n=1 Tax=Methylopila sp. Yamaguchi TaxID=1437817 RepID=UPI0021015765|nr:DMT family transporter [Methylopila sp. Yamaguchi]
MSIKSVAPHRGSDRRHGAWNARGAAFMVLAMLGFAVEDTFLKLAAQSLPIGQVLMSFGAVGLAAFSAMAIAAGERPVSRAVLSRVVLVRSLFEVTGRLFFMLAIALTPLSTASAILQSTPLVVIAGAAAFFNESVGVRRWLAVLVGLGGVLLILRPGADGFSLLSVFAVIATLGFAGRDLATRAAPPSLSQNQLGVLGFASLVFAGLVALPFGAAPELPDAGAALSLGVASCAGIVAYGALTTAMRTGEISAVTPFRYTRLVFAILTGVIVFNERPDLLTLVGSTIVVMAGIIALTRARRSVS